MTKYGALLLEYRALLKDKAVFLREVHRRRLVESMYACECVFCVYAYVYICAHTNTCCACIHRCIHVCMGIYVAYISVYLCVYVYAKVRASGTEFVTQTHSIPDTLAQSLEIISKTRTRVPILPIGFLISTG